MLISAFVIYSEVKLDVSDQRLFSIFLSQKIINLGRTKMFLFVDAWANMSESLKEKVGKLAGFVFVELPANITHLTFSAFSTFVANSP